ncbi:MAG: FAD:protein FMN transferase [Planctomycetaceae bacterium]|nr:FAD:protein FMN transferase [Planctomycetaceae bacterium]
MTDSPQDGLFDAPSTSGSAARRRFIQGQDLWRWWSDWGRTALQSSLRPLPTPLFTGLAAAEWRPNGFYSHFAAAAMACEWEVFLNYGQYAEGAERAAQALENLEYWESLLSVFRVDSEISQVNRFACEQPVTVSETTFEVLSAAENLWHLTDGAFDVTSGSLSECWGFLRREGRMPSEHELAVALESVGMDKVILRSDDRSVRLLHPGTKINLGGIGKGWTLDRLAAILCVGGIYDFTFHGGQSSVLAMGSDGRYQTNPTQPAVDARAGWPIGVSHPIYPDRKLGEIDLRNRALGTSGSARQFFHYRGKRLSHVLDPRTGRPAEGVWSATVVAPTAAQADALGTACFVLGLDGCQRLVEHCPDLGILLVVPDGMKHQTVVLGDLDKAWYPKEN